ncbi:GDP-mannose 4,6-dehydratase [Clostridia bacterium]|nr:GDP-mannose 4,6-dehydratase [Clostridia bacterium]
MPGKRALITGGGGFVGRHLRNELEASGYTVFGIDRIADSYNDIIDLLDKSALADYVRAKKPDVIFHLAAQSSVALSWTNPADTFNLNVCATINLLDAVKSERPHSSVVIVGTSSQYDAKLGKIIETDPQNPQDPYGISKKAQEEMARLYAKAYNLRVCMTRSFNHIGPGQRRGFLVPDLCAGIKARKLKVGNLEAIRDFTDVRDVVRAYRLLAEQGKSGEAYNVGSGKGLKISEILQMLISLAGCEIKIEQDEAKLRPLDNPIAVCDNTKLRETTGWTPEISLEQSLRDSFSEISLDK